jgi:AcrR family transcriptional regulator
MAADKPRPLSPRRERRRERMRGAIRDAARIVLERKGYGEATLKEIIDESDITHPTFYSYFASKEDVLADLIDALVDELVSVATPATFPEATRRSEVESSLRESLRLGFRAVLQVARTNRELLRAIREAIHASPRHAERWNQFRHRALAMVEADLEWAERVGIVRCDDRNVLARVMVGTTETAIFDLAAQDDHDLGRVESVLTDFYWNGLLGWRGGLVDYLVMHDRAPRAVFDNGTTGGKS